MLGRPFVRVCWCRDTNWHSSHKTTNIFTIPGHTHYLNVKAGKQRIPSTRQKPIKFVPRDKFLGFIWCDKRSLYPSDLWDFFSTNNKTSWIMFLRLSVFLTFRPSLLLPTWNLSLLLRIRVRAFHEMFFMISGRGAGNAVFGRGGGNPAWIINMMECNPASLCLAVSPRRSLNVSENVNKKTSQSSSLQHIPFSHEQGCPTRDRPARLWHARVEG